MRTAILKDITTKIGSGATPTGGERAYKADGISLIRSQNVLDFSFSKSGLAFIDETQAAALNNVTVEPNDILLNITGDSIARCCLVPDDILPARVNQHVSIVRCDSTVNSKYVFYYLQYLKPYLLKICGVGGTRNALTKEVIEALNINLAENQDKIAEILSSLDAKISLNNRINTELEQMARTLYNYWFVQFDFPISAAQAAAMGKPDLEGKPYKASGGEMVWNEELKREVPRGWEVGCVGDIANMRSGFAFNSNWWQDDGVPVLKIGNIQEDFSINFNGCSFVSADKIELAKEFIASPGDLIIAMTGATIGKFGIIPDIDGPILINQRVGLFDLGNEPVKQLPFLLNTLKQPYYRAMINFIASGCAQPNISASDINSLKAILPQKEFIDLYNSTVWRNYNMLILNQKQNQELTRLRDFLLPLLMNGEVTN